MRHRSRLLRVAKWVVLGLCLFLTLAAALSAMRDVSWVSQSGNSGAGLSGGYVWIGWRTKPSDGSSGVWRGPGWSVAEDPNGFRFHFAFHPKAWLTWGLLPKAGTAFGVRYFTVPLLIPLIVLAIPTSYILYRYRRPIPGHCPCGYDLTGNVSGTCPECGESAARTPS